MDDLPRPRASKLSVKTTDLDCSPPLLHAKTATSTPSLRLGPDLSRHAVRFSRPPNQLVRQPSRSANKTGHCVGAAHVLREVHAPDAVELQLHGTIRGGTRYACPNEAFSASKAQIRFVVPGCVVSAKPE